MSEKRALEVPGDGEGKRIKVEESAKPASAATVAGREAEGQDAAAAVRAEAPSSGAEAGTTAKLLVEQGFVPIR